jgi:hypothetical protein
MMMTKMSLVISVKKFTLIGLNLNFPSTLDMYTSIGYKRGKEAAGCQSNSRMHDVVNIQ